MINTQDSIQNAAGRLVAIPPRTGMSSLLAMEMLKAGGKIAVLDVGRSSVVMTSAIKQLMNSQAQHESHEDLVNHHFTIVAPEGTGISILAQEAEQHRLLMRVGRKVNGDSAQPKQVPHWHRFTKGRY